MGDKKIVSYKTTCPFCKREHEQHLYINTICECGAKFYYRDFTWLNRQTGEKFYTLDNLAFVSEEEDGT